MVRWKPVYKSSVTVRVPSTLIRCLHIYLHHNASRIHLGRQTGAPDLNAINDVANTNTAYNYAQGKLANILFARELAMRLEERGIRNVYVNAAHPGLVATRFAYNFLYVISCKGLTLSIQGLWLHSHLKAQPLSQRAFGKTALYTYTLHTGPPLPPSRTALHCTALHSPLHCTQST